MRSDVDRLSDILGAITKIESRAAVSEEAFLNDEMLQVWVVHHLQLVGEAAGTISKALREQHPEVPWAEIVAFRNIVVHEYFGLDLRQVWQVGRKDLPPLKTKIQKIRESLAPPS